MDYITLKKEFLSGISLAKLAKKYSLCADKLGKKLKLDGVVITRNNKKYTLDSKAFDKVDNEFCAYWLGFLYADGYISKDGNVLELSLARRDEGHIAKFLEFIKSNAIIKYKVNAGFPCARVFICDKPLAQALIALGCTNKKSLTLQFPADYVPHHLIRHFIRGFFDGDGCVFPQGYNLVCGSYDFIYALHEWVITYVPNYRRVKITKSRNVYSIAKCGPRAARKLLDFIYEDSSVCLDRKFEKYKVLCQHKPCRAEMRYIISAENTGKAEMPIRPEG